MCYLIRQQQAEAQRGSTTTLETGPHRLRSRWAGAVAATLVGGLALAALVQPPSTPSPIKAIESAAPAPVVARTSAVPAAAVVEQVSAPVDDGVPSAADVVKAGGRDCDQGF